MNNLYLILLSKSFGDLLVRLSWALSKPEQYQNADDITKTIGSVMRHPSVEQYAWHFSDTPLLIHAEADPHTLDPILDTLIASGVCLLVEKQETQTRISNARGAFKTVLDILPDSLKPSVRSFEQMQQEGWFPNV